jgi:hypothetical protein
MAIVTIRQAQTLLGKADAQAARLTTSGLPLLESSPHKEAERSFNKTFKDLPRMNSRLLRLSLLRGGIVTFKPKTHFEQVPIEVVKKIAKVDDPKEMPVGKELEVTPKKRPWKRSARLCRRACKG